MLLRSDYSWTERALTFWATLIVAVTAVTSLALRYVTAPVTCWLPAAFTASQSTYAHWKCFQSDTILPLNVDMNSSASRSTFHQWVPLALGVGSLLCLLPHVIWRVLSGPLLLDTHALLSSVLENQRQAAERRHVLLRDTAILLQSALKRGNSWLTVAALCRKLLACVTCFVQLVLVAAVFRPQLGQDSRSEWDENSTSVPLPTEAFLCEFQIRHLQTTMAFTVQCISPLTEVYSKAFTFLFYLFLLLLMLCVLDLLLFSARVMLPGLRDLHVQLSAFNQSEGENQETIPQLYPRFAQWLGWDGRLILSLTADHCGPLAAANLTHHLWVVFKGAPCPAAPTASVTIEGGVPGTEMESIALDDVGGKGDEKTAYMGPAAVHC